MFKDFHNFHLEVTQILTYIEALVKIFESIYCITPYEMAFLPDKLTNLNKTLLILLTCLLNDSVE